MATQYVLVEYDGRLDMTIADEDGNALATQRKAPTHYIDGTQFPRPTARSWVADLSRYSGRA